MKKITKSGLAVAATIVLSLGSLPSTAYSAECKVAEIKALSKSCKLRDQGYKPNITCTATITAPKNFFILAGEVARSTSGTTYGDPHSFSTSPYNHEVVQQNPFFSSALLQSASLTSRCSRGGGGIGDRTCYAAANVTAKAYPHSCLKEKLQEVLNSMN